MQKHYRVGTSKNTVPEDDGRSLLAKDQYFFETADMFTLDVLEERRLADLARAGNKKAVTMLIEGCQRYICSVACRIARANPELDLMDLVQAANMAIMEYMPKALQSRFTCAVLRVRARGAISTYVIEDRLIRVPYASYQRGRRAPLTISIFSPADSDRTFLDILECADWQEVGRAFDLVGVQA